MGTCIDKIGHSCGTTQGLQVFANEETGKVDGWCFSCGTFVSDPYGKPVSIDEVDLPEPKSEQQIEEEIADVKGYQCVDLPTRKLRSKVLKDWGVKVSLAEEDGKTPTASYYPITKKGKL